MPTNTDTSNLTNEELREMYGDPCEHTNLDRFDVTDGLLNYICTIAECRDCGLQI